MFRHVRLATTILLGASAACSTQTADAALEQNKVLARQFFQAIDQSAGSPDFIDAWMTPDFQSRFNSQEPMDLTGYRQFMTDALRGFPTMRHEIHYLVAENDMVAAGITLHLEHTGEYLGVAPTGRTMAVEEIVVLRFRDGKIAAEWGVLDFAALEQQLTAPESE